jgi:uncharacterized protein
MLYLMIITRCPNCKKRVERGPENRWRPFCSERCRLIDLGAWVEGRYAFPTEEQLPISNKPVEDDRCEEL